MSEWILVFKFNVELQNKPDDYDIEVGARFAVSDDCRLRRKSNYSLRLLKNRINVYAKKGWEGNRDIAPLFRIGQIDMHVKR